MRIKNAGEEFDSSPVISFYNYQSSSRNHFPSIFTQYTVSVSVCEKPLMLYSIVTVTLAVSSTLAISSSVKS